MKGAKKAERKNPNENAPATSPRSQPNSLMIGGSSSENAVRALTPMPIVMKAMPTMIQP
jgi:hypothetical protein